MNKLNPNFLNKLACPENLNLSLEINKEQTKLISSSENKIFNIYNGVPSLINEIANELGNQCCVLSIEAKNTKKNYWEVFIENGRQPTGISVQDWVLQTSKRGIGEILLTSIDNEGTGKGFDYELLEMVTNLVNIPVIASGGMGNLNHFQQLCSKINIDAIAMANVFHYNKLSISEIKNFASRENIKIRT